jgi:aquaporin Z
MRKYVTEFIGTFGLVFTVACAARSGSPFVPLAAGAALMVMVYAGGHISGGHFNPAVSLGVFLRGKLSLKDLIPYWVAQAAAAVIAGLFAVFVIQHRMVPTNAITGGHAKFAALIAELLFTFALVYVVLNVATSKDQPNNHFYGLAIGFTVAAGAFAVGGLSGGAFNPAVAIGAMFAGVLSWSNIWLYLIAEALGGALAAVAFHALNSGDVSEGPLAKLPTLS